MKFSGFLMLFLVFSILFSNIALSRTDYTVGVSPGVVDLGELEMGSTEAVEFFIITPSEEALLVSLEPVEGTLDFFKRSLYKDLIQNVSEENVVSWVKLINNPVELLPSNETLQIAGATIRGQRKISFLLELPDDAEAGYHTVSIKPVPYTASEAVGPVGTRIIAITAVNILFNVKGSSIRKGVILDAVSGNYRGNDLEINTYFQNVGTTTISAKAFQKVYNAEKELIEEIQSQIVYLEPKEIRTLTSYLPSTGLSLGEYKIDTIVDYTSDRAILNSTINLYEPPPPEKVEVEEFISPLLIILVLVLIVLIIIYRRLK